MGWQDLLCASCGGRVGDGRCPTCRAAREQFLSERPTLAAGAVAAGCALLALLLVLLRVAGVA